MNTIARWLDPRLIESLNHLALGAKNVSNGIASGMHRSPIKGSSLEFRQHRAYSRGDEPRRIDWRVLARTDRVFVKEYEGETNLRATIVLDASGSMGYGGARTKFDYAGRLTAALTYLMLAQGEGAGMVIASTSAPATIAPGSAVSQLSRVIEALNQAAPIGPTSLVEQLGRVADRADRRSLIIIISDFLLPVSALQPPLSRLAFERHEMVLLRTLHPDEINFPFDRWMTFHGLERERTKTLDLAATRQHYLEQFKVHEQALSLLCGRLSASLLTQTIDKPLIEAVRAVVYRRSV